MSPVSGKITEANSVLEEKPGTINQSPEQDGWLARIELKDASELEGLMDGAADSDSSEEGEETADEEDDDEVLDEEEEREKKLRALEQDLDGLYESYQERMRERDAKYRVKEARRKDKTREEWGGIKKDGSEDEESDEEEGGWDTVQAAKARADESSDSDSSDESDEDQAPAKTPQPSKKRRAEEVIDLTNGTKKARTNGSISQAATADVKLSRSTEVWFSQGLFKSAGIDDIESDDDEDEQEAEDEDVEMDGSGGSEPETAEVCRLLRACPLLLLTRSLRWRATATTMTLKSCLWQRR